ncbi:hypothetical protein KCU83_g1722, partial [Aureobasidium melanogenum]
MSSGLTDHVYINAAVAKKERQTEKHPSWEVKTLCGYRAVKLLSEFAAVRSGSLDTQPPSPSGIKLIVDIAMGFTKFFGKLTDMLDRLSEIIAPLERYAERFELLNVGNALIDVYGNILDFCKASSALFLDKSGRSKVPTTLKIFLHSQWVPFEAEFVKEREDFLRWLSPYDFDHKQKQTFKTKHEGTGDWLLQTSEFVRWVTEPSSQLLWCHGKPGAGKSVLASNVVNHIQKSYAGKQTGLCFAYFSFTDPTFQDYTRLVALFLKQLYQQHDEIPERLLKAERDAREPIGVLNTEMFTSVTELYPRVFIVIDGLDECPEERRSPILEFMVESSSDSSSNLKIFVSSRKELDISTQFAFLNTPAIELKTGTITPDIRSFVQHEASRLRIESKLRVRDDDLFEEIIQKLVEESNGMFLWVSLQLQQLCRISRAGNDQYVKRALDHLSQGLIAMYTRMLNDIAGGPMHTSPLGFAIQKNHLELTKVLLQANVNSNVLLGTKGQVPLMMAASLEMVKFLCETYNFDINATDNVGRSVLGYFVGAGPYLLDRYVDAAEATRVIDYLIERGADIYVKSMAGMSLIDYAVCREDDVESLQLLLERGPNLFDKEADEWTPLHWACREGNIEMAKLLLEHGQEAKKVTTVHPPKDWTPYDILIHFGSQDESTPESSDKSTICALGRPKVIVTDRKLSEEPLDYSKLIVEIGNAPKPNAVKNPTCQLCVRKINTGLSFHCTTCSYTTCLMCNHTLHTKQPGHILEAYYNFKTGRYDLAVTVYRKLI